MTDSKRSENGSLAASLGESNPKRLKHLLTLRIFKRPVLRRTLRLNHLYAGVDDACEDFGLPNRARLPSLSLTRCIIM
jgi:hypothetical protein